MGDFHRSVEIARFLPMNSPHTAKPFAIPKTVTHFFCNVPSHGRFSPIGGNRAIFTDECFPQIAKQFAIPETVTDFFRNVQRNGRFSPIGGNRAIFTDECSPKSPKHSHHKNNNRCLLQCSEQWAIFTDRWKSGGLYR